MVSAWPEPPNVKSAGAPYGVQGTFAVNGIDTLEPVSRIRGAAFGSPLPFWKGYRLSCPATFPRHGLSWDPQNRNHGRHRDG